jgi:hypothetical protein
MASLPHTQSDLQLFKLWNVDPLQGLTTDQVNENRRTFGENGTSLLDRSSRHVAGCKDELIIIITYLF